ncbi:hypothetical protein GALMADRAFT_242364 [Galerina marginata CBS 339.88]|uniref:DUF5648 domain-containing protein n=1 Tax=Galerina marginata (strain CBS 339.88) TaxID=685588 RepID=A0A067TAF0_GALM3|nr:hypothetical protein GALMADRAFT_242364 [Galerina marginata CBS 339.88]
MKNNILTALALLFLCHILDMGTLASRISNAANSTDQRRAADTCGDPSLSTLYYKAFSQQGQFHGLDTESIYTHAQASTGDWVISTPAFRAWLSPGQPSTVPLYGFAGTGGLFYITSTTGTTPTAPSGFTSVGIRAYVYATQICGSVPLYGASLPSATDFWYTTNLNDHNSLLNLGWTDTGITAYVLPVDTCSCSS